MNFADRFYSVGELAALTGYHPDSIYRAIARGALAAAKPGGKWLIPHAMRLDDARSGGSHLRWGEVRGQR